MCHQNSLRFYNGIAYDETYNGLVMDEDEGARIARLMGDKNILFHRNHGVMVCAATVAQAFDDLYYLERAAQVQVLAMSAGQGLQLISDAVAQKFLQDMGEDYATSAQLHFEARKRELLRSEKDRGFAS